MTWDTSHNQEIFEFEMEQYAYQGPIQPERKKMSKDHEGDLKQYIHLSEAWYADANKRDDTIDEVMFGFYCPDGGTSGEIGMRWHNLSRPYIEGDKCIAPRLEVFNDAWHALAQFKDVIDALAELDDTDITPKEFCQILGQCGFTDQTPRKREDG